MRSNIPQQYQWQHIILHEPNNSNNNSNNNNNKMENDEKLMQSDLQNKDNSNESVVEMFIRRNKGLIDRVSVGNDDTILFSKIMNLVTNIIEHTHDQGWDRLFSRNVSEIQTQHQTIKFKKLDSEIKDILTDVNLRYNHCIFGHQMSNIVFY